MDSEVKVEAKFKGISRRFEIHSGITWKQLAAILSNLFNLGTDFRLKYCVDENELVLISSQEELEEALKVYQKKQRLLNLFIEDSSNPQTTDGTLLNLENRNRILYQGKTKGMDSCYAAAATSIAPDFTEMNARLESKRYEKAIQTNKPAVSSYDEQESLISEGSAISIQEKSVHTEYVDFQEVMAQFKSIIQAESANNQNQLFLSFGKEQSNQQNANESVNSRGWFGHFEDQRQQQPSTSGNCKTKKNRKKKGSCYSELASAVAPQLATINIKVPQKKTREDFASETDDTDISEPSEPTSNVSVFSPPPKISGGSLNSPQDLNQQQTIQDEQQRKFKRPRCRKRRGKKKGCYAQTALDIAPLYHAMNDRLKEQQQQQQDSQGTFSLNFDSEDLTPKDSPSTESSLESYIFVNSQDGQPSLSPTSMDTQQTEVADDNSREDLLDDVVEDGAIGHSSQPPEQQVDLGSSGNDMGMKENVDENEDINVHVVVKEVIDRSMESIVEKTVQRMQQLALNPSKQVSSDEDSSSSTDVDEISKVLHRGITCENCENEIQGVRYKCCNCQDFDLCESCESKNGAHDVDHVFVKLKFPAPGIGLRHGEMVPIFKNSVYKEPHDKKLKKAEKKAADKQLKHAIRAQEKERKREKRHLRKEKKETRKAEQQLTTDPRAQKMAKVYEKLKMEYVHDVSFLDGSAVFPGQKFLKTWVIQNTGTIAWNQWIKLECIEGDIMVTPGKDQGRVPHLMPGEQGEVSVEFIAPELPGTFSSKWHLTYGLHTFGPHLWCEIQVATPSNADKEKPAQYDQTTLVNSVFEAPSVPSVALVEDTKLQALSYPIEDDGSGSEYLSSEEIPETQQGRGLINVSDVPLSSVEAQQRLDLEWDAGCVYDVEVLDTSADNEESFNLISFSGAEDIARSNNSEDSDDEEGSVSSLDEFTVLIPPCFHPDVPLSADPMPVKVELSKRGSSFSSKLLPESFELYLNLDDNNEPSSLPIMSSSVASFENMARNSNELTKVQSAPVLAPDVDADQGEETPSGRISPIEHSVQTSTQTPVSRQPHITPGETVPQPLTVADRTHFDDGRTSIGGRPLPANVVSEVISSAFDVVTNAGRAAIATVDNFINGGVQASATYEPEEKCNITIDRPTDASDVPPQPLVSRAPGNDLMTRLIEMGFADRRLNEQLLRKHNNDIRAAIDELLSHTENEWSSQRH